MTEFTENQRDIMKKIAREVSKETVTALHTDLVEEIIPRVVKETLISVGIDSTNIQEVQADHAHLRRHRKSSEKLEEMKLGMWFKVLGGLITAGLVAYLSFSMGHKL